MYHEEHSNSTSGQDLLKAIQHVASKIDDVIAKSLNQGRPLMGSRIDRLTQELFNRAYYYPSAGGKRVRPFVTVMAGRLFGDADEALYMAGASVELLHNFTLIHDDIMDADKTRRGLKTAHEAFGLANAINVGDYLRTRAILVAYEAERLANVNGIVASLAESECRISEGQNMDMAFESMDDVTVDEYLEMIQGKTGALFECSSRIGGIIGGVRGTTRSFGDQDQIHALSSYGINLGIVFQIRDDYLGTFGEQSVIQKPVGNDIRNGKKTLVVISALESASPSQARQIRQALGNAKATEAQINRALTTLRDLKADVKCQTLAQAYADKSVSALSRFAETEGMRHLTRLARFAATRNN